MRESHSILDIWVYLSGSPLLALFITLGAYQLGLLAYQRSGQNPLANPVAIAVLLVACLIQGIDMPYATYFAGAQFVHFLLGSATVALAVPIYRGLNAIRGRALPLLLSLLVFVAMSALALALRARRDLGASLVPDRSGRAGARLGGLAQGEGDAPTHASAGRQVDL